jgi:hypothetical protein
MPDQAIVQESWPLKLGRVRYRVTVRDSVTRETLGVLRDLETASCDMPQEWSDSPTTELRVEVADVDADGKAREWATWLPYYFISPLATGGTLLEGPATPDGFPIRLVVRPTQGEEILLDQARRDARFALPESLLKAAPRLKYKFMRYDHDQKKWVDACGYVILKTSQVPAQSSGATISSTWQPNETKSLAAPFLFTVDVEVNLRYQRLPNVDTAVDEQIFGITPKGGAKEYGIPYIMDALEEHRMKGTFFIDILMEFQLGERGLRRTLDAILARGHDVQLHLHPNPNLYFATDRTLRELGHEYALRRTVTSFERALNVGVELFQKRVGYAPTAFRNGAYVIADEYFSVLRNFGIKFDSSLYAYKNASVSPWLLTRSVPFQHPSGIIEVPVTWVLLRGAQGTRVRQHTINIGSDGARIDEAMITLFQGARAPVVMVTHSYTFLADQRDLPQSAQVEWDAQLQATATEFVFDATRMGKDCSKITMDGPHPERLRALSERLDLVASSGARSLTFSDLASVPVEELVLDLTVDPVVEFDASQERARITGLQRYGRSYLEHLDSHG